MKKSGIISIITAAAMLIMLFTGCSPQNNETNLAKGGTLLLKVNPEIAISYDENGNVTKLESRNRDAQAILQNYTGFEGRRATEIVKELVGKIGDAGYFVEEVEGERRHIVIEIEKGSVVPDSKFMDNVVAAVKDIVNDQKWYSPLDVVNGKGYGYTDYVDTDYGLGNDGITDYVDTDYGEGADGVTDFYDTDYGYKNDGVTDFGKTNYDATDYGPQPSKQPAANPATQSATKPAPQPPKSPSQNRPGTDYGRTDYNVTDYHTTDYGRTDYNDGTDYH